MLGSWRRSAFISIRDVGLFMASARSDARLATLRVGSETSSGAFDRLYADAPLNDPWASALPQYRYQQRKYDALMRLLRGRRYRRALDLGCGLGLLTERLASRVDEVLGIDISKVALRRAAERTRAFKNVGFRQGDILSLDPELDGRFDLIVVADTIYYLPSPIRDETLKYLADRVARLLTPDGVLLLVNHYFPMPNAETRLTLRIHRAFHWSPALSLVAEHRRNFFLASLLSRTPAAALTP
jgi:SAM-dependent methyltransferase